MKNPKYMYDSYLKEFDTVVKSVNNDKFIVLEDTIIYPTSGGQPHDTGKLIRKDGEIFNVIFAGKFNGEISNEVDKPGLKVRDSVKIVLDWDRRYKHMRYHTAAHIISGVLHEQTGALITGNQISEEKLRIDFNLDNFDREELQKYIDISNKEAEKDIEVKAYFKPKEEAMKLPGLIKLANTAPPDLDILRIVEIPGVDLCADGGTHVHSTKEVGKLEILKIENKGKNNRRMYVVISD
ncbi:alanyl-tRNA editing protein [Candidatus Woesearchaeota archaeon]|nr:alanyl-tRNA editing protein [Candidatus Woesearchaeota archaeon]MCF7901159.1 alanyl-tRNA editing protein [Candidatus Woesearchaeota archaeon]MCF8013664.1 alanyl-tRNA editing protein [Candidatus Woesearchaeota archaeon]